MKIKKYYATDMQEALRQIKEELGPDAVIISSKLVRAKRGPLGLFSKRVIEVVASYEEKDRPAPKKRPAQKISRPEPAVKPYAMDTVANNYKNNSAAPRESAAAAPSFQSVQAQMMQAQAAHPSADIDSQLGELKRMLERVSTKMDNLNHEGVGQFNDEVAALFRRLTEQDVDEELAAALCEQAQDIAVRKGAPAAEVLESLLYEALGSPVHISPTKFQRKVVMIIGPTGVGKTTTLVKLASHMIVNQGLSVGIINSDVYRVGAQEQLKTYCEILGITMHTIYNPDELEDTLEELKDADVVFLDTAGKVSGDGEYQKEIAELVKRGSVDQIYLTISASTSNKTMKEILKNYSFLSTHSLMLTKLDEVGTKGALLNACHYSGRPLSYITVGQTVPDDIQMVSTGDIVSELIG